jgi:hypothetical protein
MGAGAKCVDARRATDAHCELVHSVVKTVLLKKTRELLDKMHQGIFSFDRLFIKNLHGYSYSGHIHNYI